MLRSLAGVIAGCVLFTAFSFTTFAGAYFAFGTERTFKPDSYEVSMLWLLLSAVIGLAGSALAGYVCAAISRSKRICELLAGILLIGLVLFSMPKLRDPTFHIRAGEISMTDAMSLAQMPTWLYLASPVLGAVGVLIGARKRLSRPEVAQ